MDPQIRNRQSTPKKIETELRSRARAHQAAIRTQQVRLQAGPEFAAVQPKAMLAIGDSWFDYPLTGNGLPYSQTDVIGQLQKIVPASTSILNYAAHGDASTDMMSLPKQARLISALRNKANWIGNHPDAILVSAGGNDIAGEQFCIFLDPFKPGSPGLDKARLDKALGAVEASYLALFAIRDNEAPGVPIVGHCYDFAIPNGTHPMCAGPWLKPSLDFKKWPAPQARKIVHDALLEFRSLLKGLAANPANRFTLVDTQGTLKDAEWANELHPHPQGFKKIADLFAKALGF